MRGCGAPLVEELRALGFEAALANRDGTPPAGARVIEIFGEISPDCMRCQLTLDDDPASAESADKDLWRSGKTPELLLARYETLYRRIFGDGQKKETDMDSNKDMQFKIDRGCGGRSTR